MEGSNQVLGYPELSGVIPELLGVLGEMGVFLEIGLWFLISAKKVGGTGNEILELGTSSWAELKKAGPIGSKGRLSGRWLGF